MPDNSVRPHSVKFPGLLWNRLRRQASRQTSFTTGSIIRRLVVLYLSDRQLRDRVDDTPDPLAPVTPRRNK